MDKTAVFACPNPDATLSKGVELMKEYYTVKNYKVEIERNGYEVRFRFIKNNLYHRIMRTIPVILGLWSYADGQLHVSTSAGMAHGSNRTIFFVDKLTTSSLGVGQKAAAFLTDPMFGKAFSEEFMVMSEAMADVERNTNR